MKPLFRFIFLLFPFGERKKKEQLHSAIFLFLWFHSPFQPSLLFQSSSFLLYLIMKTGGWGIEFLRFLFLFHIIFFFGREGEREMRMKSSSLSLSFISFFRKRKLKEGSREKISVTHFCSLSSSSSFFRNESGKKRGGRNDRFSVISPSCFLFEEERERKKKRARVFRLLLLC